MDITGHHPDSDWPCTKATRINREKHFIRQNQVQPHDSLTNIHAVTVTLRLVYNSDFHSITFIMLLLSQLIDDAAFSLTIHVVVCTCSQLGLLPCRSSVEWYRSADISHVTNRIKLGDRQTLLLVMLYFVRLCCNILWAAWYIMAIVMNTNELCHL